jgi:hypothetical protein
MKTRRVFLRGMLFAAGVIGLSVGLSFGHPQEFPRKPQPVQLPLPDIPNPPAPEKRMSEEDAKEIRNVERLHQLATELKAAPAAKVSLTLGGHRVTFLKVKP